MSANDFRAARDRGYRTVKGALNAAGVPTYGISGMFHDAEGSHAHGLNERIRVAGRVIEDSALMALLERTATRWQPRVEMVGV